MRPARFQKPISSHMTTGFLPYRIPEKSRLKQTWGDQSLSLTSILFGWLVWLSKILNCQDCPTSLTNNWPIFSACLFVCLFACLFVCLLVCLFVCLFVCLRHNPTATNCGELSVLSSTKTNIFIHVFFTSFHQELVTNMRWQVYHTTASSCDASSSWKLTCH